MKYFPIWTEWFAGAEKISKYFAVFDPHSTFDCLFSAGHWVPHSLNFEIEWFLSKFVGFNVSFSLHCLIPSPILYPKYCTINNAYHTPYTNVMFLYKMCVHQFKSVTLYSMYIYFYKHKIVVFNYLTIKKWYRINQKKTNVKTIYIFRKK